MGQIVSVLGGGALPTLPLTISTNVCNYDINVAAGSPAGPVSLIVTINPGVRVGSTSTGAPALTTGGLAPGSNVLLINNGLISGRGGNGGKGGDAFSTFSAGNGGNGGVGLELTVNLTLDNQGQIYGGGGGGGGGSGFTSSTEPGSSGGGGGAGGGNCGFSSGGGGGGRTGGCNFGFSGSGGGLTTGGAGGPLSCGGGGGCNCGSSGGNGGNAGFNGSVGGSQRGSNPGAGGAGGASIRSNGNAIVYTTVGDLRGLNTTGVGSVS